MTERYSSNGERGFRLRQLEQDLEATGGTDSICFHFPYPVAFIEHTVNAHSEIGEYPELFATLSLKEMKNGIKQWIAWIRESGRPISIDHVEGGQVPEEWFDEFKAFTDRSGLDLFGRQISRRQFRQRYDRRTEPPESESDDDENAAVSIDVNVDERFTAVSVGGSEIDYESVVDDISQRQEHRFRHAEVRQERPPDDVRNLSRQGSLDKLSHDIIQQVTSLFDLQEKKLSEQNVKTAEATDAQLRFLRHECKTRVEEAEMRTHERFRKLEEKLTAKVVEEAQQHKFPSLSQESLQPRELFIQKYPVARKNRTVSKKSSDSYAGTREILKEPENMTHEDQVREVLYNSGFSDDPDLLEKARILVYNQQHAHEKLIESRWSFIYGSTVIEILADPLGFNGQFESTDTSTSLAFGRGERGSVPYVKCKNMESLVELVTDKQRAFKADRTLVLHSIYAYFYGLGRTKPVDLLSTTDKLLAALVTYQNQIMTFISALQTTDKELGSTLESFAVVKTVFRHLELKRMLTAKGYHVASSSSDSPETKNQLAAKKMSVINVKYEFMVDLLNGSSFLLLDGDTVPHYLIGPVRNAKDDRLRELVSKQIPAVVSKHVPQLGAKKFEL